MRISQNYAANDILWNIVRRMTQITFLVLQKSFFYHITVKPMTAAWIDPGCELIINIQGDQKSKTNICDIWLQIKLNQNFIEHRPPLISDCA